LQRSSTTEIILDIIANRKTLAAILVGAFISVLADKGIRTSLCLGRIAIPVLTACEAFACRGSDTA